MQTKLNIAVIYGGQSPEHEISLLSANNVLKALNPKKYTIFPVYISKEGRWYHQPNALSDKVLTSSIAAKYEVLLSADKTFHFLKDNNSTSEKIDVAFPVLHGPNGEDGTIQGLLQLLGIPFVGPDLLGTAITMDKDLSKRLLRAASLPTPNSITLKKSPSKEELNTIIEKLGLPCFVKPCNMGSSVGIAKVKQASELSAAIQDAFQYDNKVIIEEQIAGREIEVAVLGNRDPEASLPAEINLGTKHEYYSYEAKYDDNSDTTFEVPAKLTSDQISKVQDIAKKAYLALECNGMARVDFFLTQNNEFYINELNAIPGFTNVSMYPRMWEASGLTQPALFDKLINLAFEYFDSKHTIKRSKG